MKDILPEFADKQLLNARQLAQTPQKYRERYVSNSWLQPAILSKNNSF